MVSVDNCWHKDRRDSDGVWFQLTTVGTKTGGTVTVYVVSCQLEHKDRRDSDGVWFQLTTVGTKTGGTVMVYGFS